MMKTKWIKPVFLIVCVGVILFLLLPFLETTAPSARTSTLNPQVVTSNPLVDIARRMASLFAPTRERNRQRASAPAPENTPAQELLAGAQVRAARIPLEGPEPFASQSGEVISVPPAAADSGYEEASFQTDGGQWVLIRQVPPAASQPGMHEVNAHEDSYTRYVRQERAGHLQPRATEPEIPDSKWARMTRPIKAFLGFDTPTPVQTRPISLQQENAHALHLASAKDGQRAKEKSVSGGPVRPSWELFNMTPLEWSRLSQEERQQYREREGVTDFSEMLTGTRAAEDAAEIAATAKYPNPKNEREEQEKEAYKQRLTQQNKEQIKNGILETIQANAAENEPTDELALITSCKNASLPAACNVPDQSPLLPADKKLPAAVIQDQQTKNANTFFEKTGYHFPSGLPITPVLGPTATDSFTRMAQAGEQEQKTAEIYQFLSDQQHCDSQTCYWIPNTRQIDPQLTDAVTTTNAHIRPDPKQLYPTYEEAFIAYKQIQLGEEATDEQRQQMRQDAQKQFTENAVHFVPYTAEQLKEVQQQTLTAANPENKNRNRQDITVLYVTDPALAGQVANDIDSVIFGYGQQSLAGAANASEAGEQIVNSFAQNVNDAKEVILGVTRPQYQQGIRATVGAQANPTQATQGPASTQTPGLVPQQHAKPVSTGWGDIFESLENKRGKSK